jgi:mono/diheme cytochrome c family protein
MLRSRPGKHLASALALLSCAGVIAACGGDDDDSSAEERTTPQTEVEEQPLSPEQEQGRELFVENCGTCHTLESAGTQGQIGPNLDEANVDEATVLEVIANGGYGSGNMPANLVTGADAQAVAAYVAAAGD